MRKNMALSISPDDDSQPMTCLDNIQPHRIQATYRSVFENTGTATIIVEKDMTIVKANAKFEQLSGYARAEIEGRLSWPEFVHPDYVAMMKGFHLARRSGEGQPPTEYECRVVTRGGQVRDIQMKVGMIPGTGQSILSFMDITALREAEQTAIHHMNATREIVDLIDGYVYTCSEDYRIEFMNRRLIEHIGWDGTGHHCFKVLHELEKPCSFCVNKRVFQGEAVRWEMQNPKDQRWYYSMNTPVFKDGQVVRKQSVIIDITDRKLAEEKLQKEHAILKHTMQNRQRFGRIVGKCPRMQEVYQNILQAAATDSPVIVYGESGTGKELVARAIHEMSARRAKPFITVNCGAIPSNLLESEFFGHVPGAFTGADRIKKGHLEVADRGSLFLDEIGEIELMLQPKLLRAIEGGGYTPVGAETLKHPDVRIIAATNRDLQKLVSEGRMRSDFYYRVHVIPIYLPPLRERTGDLPLLIDHIMAEIDPHRTRPISSDVMTRLLDYHWPGNVRELQNALRQYVALGHLALAAVAPPRTTSPPTVSETLSSDRENDLQDMIQAYEKKIISLALQRNRWHRTKAAESLGINRRTLFKKMKQHALD
jgi:PAS domain S-box-containing protein